jgi:cytochrome c oxidase subunit 4
MTDAQAENLQSPRADHGFPHSQDTHLRSLFIVYVSLMVLLVLTVAVSFKDMGELNIIVAMLIAVTKAVMVVMIFMHVKDSGKLVWVFASASFLWLAIMFTLTFSDYGTRNTVPRGDAFTEHYPFEHVNTKQPTPQPRG